MTENLLQHIEEKVRKLLSEVKALRSEIAHVKQENVYLQDEQDCNATKLQSLISLLDVVNTGVKDEMVEIDSIPQTEDAVS